ncbi:MAG: alpha/beta fold hydrolase, partial [Anaerolineales bacterium]|nr:alpha/beta fold hydrolase [Anaerolineales bacterium]
YDYTIFDEEYGNHADRVKEMIWKTAMRLLDLGVDVVLDWSLWNPERRQKWVTRITEAGADYKLYYLNIPQLVLHQRLAERNEARPEGTHFIPAAELDRFRTIFQPPTEEEALHLVEMHFGHDKPIHNSHLDGDSFLWEGGRTGILLLHGLTATPAEIIPLARLLHAAGYTVSGPLLPGHGTRPEDLNRVTWHDWTWEAEQAYQYLATVCDHVFVGGESTGAVVALYLASQHPEIAGVLNYAPAIQLALPVSDVIKLYAAAPFIEFMPKEQAGGHPRWQGYPVNPLRGVMELIRLGREVRRLLPQIKRPLLVIQGRHDKTIDPESGNIIIDGAESEMTELHWMENSTHVVLLDEELEAIAALTQQFMEQVMNKG